MKDVEKILLVKLRAIGDVVLSTIVLDNLRAAYPQARIDFLTEESCAAVVVGNPILNNVLIMPRGRRHLFKRLRLLLQVRHVNYDLVFDFFGNPRSAILTWLSGARIRVGYDFRVRKLAYNRIVPSRAKSVHEADWHLDGLSHLGLPIVSKQLNFAIGEGSRNFAQQYWRQAGLKDVPVIALNFSGGWPTKKWPLDRFAHLADLLIDDLGAAVLLLWGPGEKPEAELLRSLASRPVRLIPETTLKQLAALLERADLLVTTDSGPMHIAAAMGTPCVALFGPTHPGGQGPYGEGHQILTADGVDCLGCNRTRCESMHCMSAITVGETMNAVQRCITENNLFNSLA